MHIETSVEEYFFHCRFVKLTYVLQFVYCLVIQCLDHIKLFIVKVFLGIVSDLSIETLSLSKNLSDYFLEPFCGMYMYLNRLEMFNILWQNSSAKF